MKTIFNFLITSSANSEKTSLTIKAGIPFILLTLGWFGIAETEISPLLSQGVDEVINIIAAIATIVSGGYTVYGIFRKIYYLLFK